MTRDNTGEVLFKRLVLLAQQQRGEAGSERRFISEVDRRLGERAARRRSRRLAAGAAAVAMCAGLAVVAPRWLTPAPLAYRVSDALVKDGAVESAGNARVLFSDGSAVSLEKDARARIEEVSAHGARVALERGQVRLDIVKAEHNAWFVQAGPYRVHVTGTVFDVRWSAAEQRFELDLKRGSVVVTGPTIPGLLTLRAGQKVTSVPGSPVKIDGLARRAETAEAASSAPVTSSKESAVASNAPPVTPGAPSGERRGEGASSSSWPQLVALGQFQKVLDSARRRGIDDVLSNGALTELAALADAARYARSTELARKVLLVERRRFPRSAAARDAAFFLGGLEEDGSSASLVWYERYLAESPRGTYTSQALGRRMMILYRKYGLERGKALATEYLSRFPKGPYASAARKLLDRSQP